MNGYGPFVRSEIIGNKVIDYFSGSSNVTRTGFGIGKSFSISNDGNSQLTFTINGMTITVKSGEVFDDNFEDFTSVDVQTTADFRAIIRG